MLDIRRPVVAYTIPVFENEDGPRYCIYCDAYGLEMTIDDEWPIDTILLAPPELVDVITDETDVTSMGTVYAGASAPPADGDFTALAGIPATWVLLGEADDISGALAAGLKVILCVDPSTDLASVLERVSFDADQIIVAVKPDGELKPTQASALAIPVRKYLASRECRSARILIAAPCEPDGVVTMLGGGEIDGVLLHESSFGEVEEILRAMSESVEG